MGRARIRGILAALRPALAGLLLIALLVGGAAPRPARAAERPSSNGDLEVITAAALPDSSGPRQRSSPREAAAGATDATALTATMERDRATPAPNHSPSSPVPAATHAWAAGETTAQPAATPLERRLQQWPAWRLPAPLSRPGRQAPVWPGWFSGDWQVETTPLPLDAAEPPQPSPPWQARFLPDGRGGAVADRATNALSVGRSLLGERLLSVQDDPANPQRQLARLAGDQLLETSLIGQRGESPAADRFLNDELSLQVLHRPGEPRLSRIETLGRWQLQSDGTITGEQWQARYGSPADGLSAAALSSQHWRLRLVPVPPGSDRATGTTAPAADCR